MNINEEKEFVSLETLCEKFSDIPLSTARIYASQGKLPGVVPMGTRVYVHLPTFRAAMLKHIRKPKNGGENGK
ncbi:MAG: hypothetical protein ACM3SR_07790 [Ignavibacteriales bacterium]|jgi:hypothetical protein